MRIGFVGLGNMGSGMASDLLRAGHEVTAYNRSQEQGPHAGPHTAAAASRHKFAWISAPMCEFATARR